MEFAHRDSIGDTLMRRRRPLTDFNYISLGSEANHKESSEGSFYKRRGREVGARSATV